MARTARRAGRDVVIANSRGPESLTSEVSVLDEAVSAGAVDEAATAGIVVIAVPWDRVPEAVQGLYWNIQVVIDATNDWAADDLQGRTSSELVAGLVAGAARRQGRQHPQRRSARIGPKRGRRPTRDLPSLCSLSISRTLGIRGAFRFPGGYPPCFHAR
jgi:8-hydroxy-5-deazaflavin:NADPH oxidoreductase